MGNERATSQKPVYQIGVQGSIDESWSEWFEGMTVAFEEAREGAPTTTLTGPVADQAALRGLLTKAWDLNLTVVSVSLLSQIELGKSSASISTMRKIAAALGVPLSHIFDGV